MRTFDQIRIIGVRYIGAAAAEHDCILSSGATWAPGQTINFSTVLAERFFKHPDLWEEAPVDPLASTILSVPGASSPRPAVAVNIHGMPDEALRMFARLEYGRVMDPDLTGSDLRNAVLNMMIDSEEHESRVSVNERTPVIFHCTTEEYAALMLGACELRLVPVVGAVGEPSDFPASTTSKMDMKAGDDDAANGEVGQKDEASEIDDETGGGAGNAPLLEDYLATLSGDELKAFAEENGLKLDSRWGDRRAREELAKAIREREASEANGEGGQS